ncbi:unnamed protein product [Ranitomeya imitator]|uniref:Uncharacterized protein n=1 Tax=Ranitomeya imitator TaxID=111125 RepID=A0ABN9KUY8_9NEOB|nr:unnamed protein product [Ranitomeya imitator]
MQHPRGAAAAEKLKKYAKDDPPDNVRNLRNNPAPSQRKGRPSDGNEERGEDELTLKQASEQLMQAISLTRSSLTEKIEDVHTEVGRLRHDMQAMRGRISEVETRVSHIEDTITPMEAKLNKAAGSVNAWKQKADDLENRLRRNNIRIIGLPERSEGQQPEQFLEEWLKSTLGDGFSSTFSVERAHRVPTRPLPPGAPPRPFLARLLNCRDRDTILRLARQRGLIKFDNATISIFPDFSMELQKQRARFMDVKKQLREENIVYSMLYPARLRIVYKGSSLFFTDPAEAIEWLRSRSYFELGNQASTLLAFLVRQHNTSNTILQIRASDGSLVSSTDKILQSFYDYYISLYKSKSGFDIDECLDYLSDITFPLLSPSQRALMEAEFTLEEVEHAIADMATGKAPGPDGFPIEFYRKYRDKLAPILLKRPKRGGGAALPDFYLYYLAGQAKMISVSSFMSELPSVRCELLGFLTHALMGDSLAAQYLVLHLISTV